jgi:hypothetical protein
MEGIMSKFALTFASQKTRLTTMVGAIPLLAPKMGLFKNNIIPTEVNVLADFIEADFTGYAQQTPVFGSVVLDENGVPVAPLSAQFTQTGVVIVNVVYGMFLLDSTGALVGAAAFDAPRAFNAIGDFEICNLLFGLGAGTNNTVVGP